MIFTEIIDDKMNIESWMFSKIHTYAVETMLEVNLVTVKK